MTIAAPTTAKPPRAGAVLESDASSWMSDPYAYFGMSNTRVHSVPRRDAEAVQLAAMNILLEKRRAEIPVLAKFADAQDIRRIASLDDMAPLLFEHNVYKTYPVSLLAKQRYDQLTQWLGRLTTHDVSGVDVSKCKSIDEWLMTLQAATPLDVATSSGTSGTMSFFPKSKRDYTTSVVGFRVQLAQKFGAEPTHGDLHDKLHMLAPSYRDGHTSSGRFPEYFKKVFCLGDEDYLHVAFPHKISSDLMWLAARLRAAAAKGDVTRVDVPEVLLARRAELERMQKDAPGQQSAFIARVAKELTGKRVFAMGTSPMFYDVARRGLAEGARNKFGPGSILMGGGGHKGMVMPEGWQNDCLEFFGLERMLMGYGMTEMNSFSITCEHGHYHLLPWVTLFILDLDTGKPKPRSGTQTGRAGFFDMTHDGTWGGILTGDQITVDWDTPCPCGRTSVAIKPTIQRVSELQGGDDKISCAATPAAQAEALDYLTSFEL
ncbi:MAG: hypothetical protein EPO08_01795 [Rhodospirillaceae bacterium]|nr:MAG: hypothetical protein EPO08_01795 [Rhodospirillaceae bacterium]